MGLVVKTKNDIIKKITQGIKKNKKSKNLQTERNVEKCQQQKKKNIQEIIIKLTQDIEKKESKIEKIIITITKKNKTRTSGNDIAQTNNIENIKSPTQKRIKKEEKEANIRFFIRFLM